MRIALVCPYDWSAHGGVRSHVASLAARLAADHTVRIVTPSSADLSGDGVQDLVVSVGNVVPVHYNDSVSPVALTPGAARRTLRALTEFAPDVVHIHEPLSPVVSAVATARGPRPVVATFHAWSEQDRGYRFVAPMARRTVAALDTRIAVSPAARSYASEALGLPPSAFEVIPNGVDVDRYAGAEPWPDLTGDDRPLLLFVGRLEHRKGGETAVRAFVRLRERGVDARLCVVGDGPQRRRCEQIVPSDLAADVTFAGSVTEHDKPRYHASADLYMAPNTGGESFGIVLLEAMAAGLPVVAADIPGFRTVLTDGVEGCFVPPESADALAAALAGLLGDPLRRRAMAERGRETAARYAWPVVTRRVQAVYARAVAAHTPVTGRSRWRSSGSA